MVVGGSPEADGQRQGVGLIRVWNLGSGLDVTKTLGELYTIFATDLLKFCLQGGRNVETLVFNNH